MTIVDRYVVDLERECVPPGPETRCTGETGRVDLRERTPEDMPALSALLRRVHDTDGYPTVWPGDVSSWLTTDDDTY